MNSFNELENIWGNQKGHSPRQSADELMEKAKEGSEKLKKGFKLTILILGITVLILTGYMFYYKTYSHRILFICNSLMILLLLFRIALEWHSFNAISSHTFTASAKNQVIQSERFYSKRKQINFVLTPLIFLTYWGTFYYLQPLFKEGLSGGMYTYVMVSSAVLFIVLAWFIYRSIKQELNILDAMRGYLDSLNN